MEKSPMRIMLVGGGSGGHFYPLIALAEELRRTDPTTELYYSGPELYDQNELERLGITFVYCPSGKSRRYTSLQNFFDLFKVAWGILIAIKNLFILYPDVIISKGSYTSVPIVIAAFFLRIPLIIHESDTRPGKANKIAARFAKRIAISFEDVRPYFPTHTVFFTGIPIRAELLKDVTNNVPEHLNLDPTCKTIFVCGGSLGAERINELILTSLNELLPLYNVIHQTGRKNYEITSLSAQKLIQDTTLLQRYHPIPFFDKPEILNIAYTVSSLIISRAGTGTIYEISAHGKPAILIPIPEEISHDQKTNAYTYAKTGAAVVLEEANLSEHLLIAEIERIMQNAPLYANMTAKAKNFAPQNGAVLLAQMVREVAQKHT